MRLGLDLNCSSENVSAWVRFLTLYQTGLSISSNKNLVPTQWNWWTCINSFKCSSGQGYQVPNSASLHFWILARVLCCFCHFSTPFSLLEREPTFFTFGNHHFPHLCPHGVNELNLKPQNQPCTHILTMANLGINPAFQPQQLVLEWKYFTRHGCEI